MGRLRGGGRLTLVLSTRVMGVDWDDRIRARERARRSPTRARLPWTTSASDATPRFPDLQQGPWRTVLAGARANPMLAPSSRWAERVTSRLACGAGGSHCPAGVSRGHTRRSVPDKARILWW
jgi:hypothetical protein